MLKCVKICNWREPLGNNLKPMPSARMAPCTGKQTEHSKIRTKTPYAKRGKTQEKAWEPWPYAQLASISFVICFPWLVRTHRITSVAKYMPSKICSLLVAIPTPPPPLPTHPSSLLSCKRPPSRFEWLFELVEDWARSTSSKQRWRTTVQFHSVRRSVQNIRNYTPSPELIRSFIRKVNIS